MNNTLQYYRLNGLEARSHFEQMAKLRISVFKEYPYLYEGTIAYEKVYLESYFKSQNCLIFLVKDKATLVGMTTCIQASDVHEEFKQVYEKFNLDPKKILYFGESILLPEYRGKGLGKVFFQEREDFGKCLGLTHFSFCAVVREDNHPLKPTNYLPLTSFWQQMGYKAIPSMTMEISWKDLNEKIESKKTMQFWMKENKK